MSTTSKKSSEDRKNASAKMWTMIKEQEVRLLDCSCKSTGVTDLFAIQVQIERLKLREYCERLIFSDPLNFGALAEDRMWRLTYYEVISLSKRLTNQNFSTQEKYILLDHIHSGIGFYHHFISKIQIKFGINLDDIVDFPITTENKCINPNLERWCKCSVYRSLLYLGDLTRYKLEIYRKSESIKSLAIRYYTQALSLDPKNGMPHNNMGILASSLNQNLDAVFHYINSLMCKKPFEGSKANLQVLFEKNANSLENPTFHNSRYDNFPINKFIARFLALVDVWFFNKCTPLIYEMIQRTNVELDKCFSYSRPVINSSSSSEEDDERGSCFPPDNINHDMINKTILICLMCITNLKTSMYSAHLQSIVSFTFELYTKLIDLAVNNIQEGILSLPLYNKARTKRRRKVTEVQFSSSESDSEDLSYDSFSSSEEDLIMKTTTNQNFEVLKKASALTFEDLLNIVVKEEALPGIKLLSDWLQGDLDIFKKQSKNSSSFYQIITKFLNMLHILLRKKAAEELDYTVVPLPEDFLCKDFDSLMESQKNLNWSYFITNKSFSIQDFLVVRVQKLLAFGKFIAQLNVGIIYEPINAGFPVFTIKDCAVINNGDILKGKMKEDLSKRMGQLWLAAEIEELEAKVKESTLFPPYLVVDVQSLIKYYFIIQSLIHTRNFIIIIPSVVICALDDLKRTNLNVRKTIKWLEKEFTHGNQFFRAQREEESHPLQFLRNQNKNDKEYFMRVQIFECCNYLAQKEKRTSNVVTFLTGDHEGFRRNDECGDVSFVELAQFAGISLELITDFFDKWQKYGKNKV